MSVIRSIALTAAFLALPPEPSVAGAAITQITHDLDLWSGPSVHSVVMTFIPAGSGIEIVTCGPRWCYVKWGASKGYSDGQYLLNYVTVKVIPLNQLH
jgi:uncharacterized protein YraI